MNSLLEKNSMFQNHFTGNKASEINKNFFLHFFVEILFAFLLHLLIENFKPEHYGFEIIWCLMFEWIWKVWSLNGYDFELYQTLFHSKNYHNRLFNSTALFAVYKWPLTIEDVVIKWTEIKLKCLKFCSLKVEVQIKVDLQWKRFSKIRLGPPFPLLRSH